MLLIHTLSFNNFHQMESAISLRYCPFPYSSKGFQGGGSVRFRHRFNHASPLCAPQFSTTRHPFTLSVGHASCMLGRFSQPSQNEGRGNKFLRGMTGASLVLACVLGLFSFKMNPKLTTAHASSSPGSFDPSSIEGNFDPSEVEGQGRFALKSLLDIMNDAEVATNENLIIPSHFNKPGPSQKEINTLKSIAIGQRKSGKGDEALKTLEEQYIKCKNLPEAEEFLGLALVEVFMLQEKLEEARKRLDQQIDERLQYSQISHRKKANKLTPKEKCEELLKLQDSEYGPRKVGIAKRIFYKAIVHTMLEDKEELKWRRGNKEALEWRKAFTKIF